MKIKRLIVLGLIVMVLAFGLAGCKITSASPDPNQIIDMKPGDKQLFKVIGPVNSLTTRCVWKVARAGEPQECSIGSNEFEFQVTPEGEPTNIIWISCEVQSLKLVQSAPNQGWTYLKWVTTDHQEWNIRILQDTKPIWRGDYIILDDIDLQLLQGYTTVSGVLLVTNFTELTSLASLEKLTSIGGGLSIYNNALTNLDGLDNLTSVGWLVVCGDNLTSLAGLESLTSVGGKVEISGKALTSLAGLENLTSVGDYLRIQGNDALTNLTGLENLTTVNGELRVYSNANLTSLAGLENLVSVGGYLSIDNNNALTALGMIGLQKVGSYFWIYDNPMLCRSLAEELMNQVLAGGGIGGWITISGNKECTTP